MSLCNRNCVILLTNIARCALYRKVFDFLADESISGVPSGRANLYIRREFLPQMFEKVSRSLKYDSNIFFVHKHILHVRPLS